MARRANRAAGFEIRRRLNMRPKHVVLPTWHLEVGSGGDKLLAAYDAARAALKSRGAANHQTNNDTNQ